MNSCHACLRFVLVREHHVAVDGEILPSSKVRLCNECGANFLLAQGEALGNLVRTRGATARAAKPVCAACGGQMTACTFCGGVLARDE